MKTHLTTLVLGFWFLVPGSLRADPPTNTSEPFGTIATYVDSADYGIVGDASTNNTTMLQAAVNAAASSDSKTLIIRAASNTYNFSGTVTIPFGVRIQGQTRPGGDTGGYSTFASNPFKVRLKYTGALDAFYFPVISSNQIADIELFGSATDGVGISVGNATLFAATTTSSSTSLTNVSPQCTMSFRPGLVLANDLAANADIPAPVTTTGTLTSGSPTFVVGSATGLANGMVVSGTGIPLGATMSISGTSVTLSANATASGSESLTFSTAVISYDRSTATIVMSNPAVGSHTASETESLYGVFDPLYPNGSNYPRFAGQKISFDNVYVHDFGVNLGVHYADGIDTEASYFGDGHFANVVLDRVSDSMFRHCYVGGSNTAPYPTAYGFHIVGEGGYTPIIMACEINQCGTAVWGAAEANITLIGVGFEVVGTPSFPAIDLHNASSIFGYNINQISPPSGVVVVRADAASKVTLPLPLQGGPGPSVTGTLSSNTTVSSITTTGIVPGEVVFGTGIPFGTFVSSVDGSTVTLSQATTVSATETLSFIPPVIEAFSEANLNVNDTLDSGRPVALIDGSNNVTSVIHTGQSASVVTHGTLGGSVSVPPSTVDYSGTELLVRPGTASILSIGNAAIPGDGIYIDSVGIGTQRNGVPMWSIAQDVLSADATNNGNAQIFAGQNSYSNRPQFTYGPGTSGLGNPSNGVSLVANSLDAISAVPVSSTVDLRLLRTMTAVGTDGAVTINKPAGCVQFAAAASSLVVTNSLVSATSHVIATVATHDATMTSVQAVAGSGTITLYGNATPTGEVQVNFLITN